MYFEEAQQAEIANLEATLGVNIITFDLFAIFGDVIANPGDYGVTNVTDACIDSDCLDPDSYLFFDGIHPTAAVHQLMGQLAYQRLAPVPLPAALPLFLVALGVFGVRRRAVA